MDDVLNRVVGVADTLQVNHKGLSVVYLDRLLGNNRMWFEEVEPLIRPWIIARSLDRQDKLDFLCSAQSILAENAKGYGAVAERIRSATFHVNGYCQNRHEPDIVALCDWNDIKDYDRTSKTYVFAPGHIHWDLLRATIEIIGAEIEWGELYTPCDRCGKLIQTTSTSDGFTDTFKIKDEEMLRESCVESEEKGHESW